MVGNGSKRMRDAIWDVYDADVLSDNNGDPLLYIQSQDECLRKPSVGKLQQQWWYFERIAGDKRRAPWFEERQLTNKRLREIHPRSRFLSLWYSHIPAETVQQDKLRRIPAELVLLLSLSRLWDLNCMTLLKINSINKSIGLLKIQWNCVKII